MTRARHILTQAIKVGVSGSVILAGVALVTNALAGAENQARDPSAPIVLEAALMGVLLVVLLLLKWVDRSQPFSFWRMPKTPKAAPREAFSLHALNDSLDPEDSLDIELFSVDGPIEGPVSSTEIA